MEKICITRITHPLFNSKVLSSNTSAALKDVISVPMLAVKLSNKAVSEYVIVCICALAPVCACVCVRVCVRAHASFLSLSLPFSLSLKLNCYYRRRNYQ